MQLPIYEVRAQAATVDRTAGEVETARDAVRQVTMDTGAYGVLCQFLPGLLSPLFGLAVEAMHGSIDALHETAAKLRGTADAAEHTDQGSAGRIRAAGHGTPRIELPL
jgi:hypothetical protein